MNVETLQTPSIGYMITRSKFWTSSTPCKNTRKTGAGSFAICFPSEEATVKVKVEPVENFFAIVGESMLKSLAHKKMKTWRKTWFFFLSQKLLERRKSAVPKKILFFNACALALNQNVTLTYKKTKSTGKKGHLHEQANFCEYFLQIFEQPKGNTLKRSNKPPWCFFRKSFWRKHHCCTSQSCKNLSSYANFPEKETDNWLWQLLVPEKIPKELKNLLWVAVFSLVSRVSINVSRNE